MRKLVLGMVARFARLLGERRGGAALMLAVILPVVFAVTALGLEVGSWSVTKAVLQRRADMAAYTAISRYLSGDTAQVAINAGVDIAALNGATAATRTWVGSPTNKLTAGEVTAQLVTGVRDSTSSAVKVVVTTSRSLAFGGLVTALSFDGQLGTKTAVTVTATAYGEILTSAGTGGQPCLVALKSNGTGITVTGGSAISLPSCTARSNAAVSVTNGSSITTPWVYTANAAATVSGGSSITNGTSTVTPTNVTGWGKTAPLYTAAGQMPDPYASNAAITAAFSSLSTSHGTAFTGTWQPSTLSPGTFLSITSGSGAITMTPGTYIVNGNISIGQGTTVTCGIPDGNGGFKPCGAEGVTIIMSGTISFGGGATVTLSAPQSTAVKGGIPGILIAGTSTSTDTLSNGMKPTLTGVIYYPNGTMAVSGGVNVGNSCLEVIAGSVSISNGASFGASCSSYGATPFYSMAGAKSTALVQ